jgi:hypothetical protein
MQMQSDLRRHSRFPYRAKAELIRLPHLYEVTLIDISEHGVLIMSSAKTRIEIGDQIRLRLLTEKGNQAFEVEALVAHRSEELVGLEISSIDCHARITLRQLIQMNLGTPELASRTLPALLKANFSSSAAAA